MKNYLPKKNLLYLMVATVLVSACAKPAEDPQKVAGKFWQLIQSGNTQAAELLVSSQSRHSFTSDIKKLNPVKQFELKDARTSVTTVLNPSATKPENNQPFNTVLVLEHGQWKIDTRLTHIPAETDAASQQQKLTNEFSKSIQNNLNTIDDAMQKGIKLLNNALRNGSKDMSESFLKGMKQLNESMQQSIKKLKQRKQQENVRPQQPPIPASPRKNQGEGII